jgi:hypothetical protein
VSKLSFHKLCGSWVRKLLRLSTTICFNLLQQRMLRWSTHTTAYTTADTTAYTTAYTSTTYTSTPHSCTSWQM